MPVGASISEDDFLSHSTPHKHPGWTLSQGALDCGFRKKHSLMLDFSACLHQHLACTRMIQDHPYLAENV
jgi:hypothetical protein